MRRGAPASAKHNECQTTIATLNVRDVEPWEMPLVRHAVRISDTHTAVNRSCGHEAGCTLSEGFPIANDSPCATAIHLNGVHFSFGTEAATDTAPR